MWNPILEVLLPVLDRGLQILQNLRFSGFERVGYLKNQVHLSGAQTLNRLDDLFRGYYPNFVVLVS